MPEKMSAKMPAKMPKSSAPSFSQQGPYTALIISSLVFIGYLLTLAPTVLWGDDALFQRTAYEGFLAADGSGHWLWFQAARLFIHLPVGDIAYRVNLLSAVAAALTIFGLYCAGRALGLSTMAAIVAMMSLSVSHTFWMHAVRAEVYTLFSMWVALELWLWAKWNAKASWPIELALFLFGIGLLSHQMAILFLPALALLLWWQRAWLSPSQKIRSFALFIAGLALFLVVIQNQVQAPNLVDSLIRYFTHSGRDFSSSFFDFSPTRLPRDLSLWLAFLALQFAGLAGILALWAIVRALQRRVALAKAWYAIAVLYFTSVFFALSYRVNDQFVFYLPSYIAFAFAIGLGWDLAANRWQWLKRPATQLLAMFLLVCTPPLVYFAASSTLAALEVNPLGIRVLPGREPNAYFLWPGKNGYYGAAEYAKQVLAALPNGSYLLADHTPYEAVIYYQRVENLRPDLHIIKIEAATDLALLVESLPEQSQIFIADNDPRYYNLTNMANVILKQTGVVYQITLSPN